MQFEVGYLLALIVVGLGVLGVILALVIGEISRWKSIFTIVLSLIIVGLGVYYYWEIGLIQSKNGGGKLNKLNSLIGLYRTVEIKTPEK